MSTNGSIVIKKRLARAIIEFLDTSLLDGTLGSDDRESIEVATSCIADSFKLGEVEKGNVNDTPPIERLVDIYTTYEKKRSNHKESVKESSIQDQPRQPGSEDHADVTGAGRASVSTEAENLKGQGNVAMQRKDYGAAIDFYTRAISISPTNPIYLSNRAAAYSAMYQHELAKQDAELAVAADPMYTKAWSRLGLARFALGDAKGSMDAYKNGIDAEGSGGSVAMRKGYETAKRRVDELNEGDDATRDARQTTSSSMNTSGAIPDLAGLASMFGGSEGGMPDLGQLMNNPMMRQMAQSVMQNPAMMQNLMNNPRLRDMASQYSNSSAGGGNGGMPDLASMLQDPNIAELARNFMGDAGRGSGP